MIRKLSLWAIALVLGVFFAASGRAETFKLTDGQEVSGKVISGDAQGMVLQKDDGSFARVPWGKVPQEALKELVKRRELKRFVEPLIEPDIDEIVEKKKAEEVPFRPPPRLERPDPKAGFGVLFSSSVGVVLFIILFLANLYAAYEVALFRNYHPALVCGLAAVAPIVTQIIFVCVPTRVKPVAEAAPEATGAAEYVPPPVPIEGVTPEAGGVTPAPGAPAHPPPTVYQRGQFTFNRRFFETKLAGFLRVVPSETEKDMVVEVSSLRGRYVASRIARIMPNDVALLVQKGGASEEVGIPYSEIQEVKVRHKDD